MSPRPTALGVVVTPRVPRLRGGMGSVTGAGGKGKAPTTSKRGGSNGGGKK